MGKSEPWLEKGTAVKVVVNGHMSLYPSIFIFYPTCQAGTN